MYDFGRGYGAEIASESTRAEYQSGEVRVYLPADPKNRGKYNTNTGKFEGGAEPTVIYEGPARWAEIRWAVHSRDTHIFNASTTARFRVQLPFRDEIIAMGYPKALEPVPHGAVVLITKAAKAPHMVGTSGRVTADVQNSNNGARTLETAWDNDYLNEVV